MVALVNCPYVKLSVWPRLRQWLGRGRAEAAARLRVPETTSCLKQHQFGGFSSGKKPEMRAWQVQTRVQADNKEQEEEEKKTGLKI